MLTIRKDQMQALSAYTRRSFEDRMVRHLGAAFPDSFKKIQAQSSEDTAIRNFIQSGILKAGQYGIRAERDVATYIEFMFLHGLDFELTHGMEPVAGFLKDPELPGDAKVFVVQELLSRQAPAASPD